MATVDHEVFDHVQRHKVTAELGLLDGAQGRHYLVSGRYCHTSPPLVYPQIPLVRWRSVNVKVTPLACDSASWQRSSEFAHRCSAAPCPFKRGFPHRPWLRHGGEIFQRLP